MQSNVCNYQTLFIVEGYIYEWTFIHVWPEGIEGVCRPKCVYNMQIHALILRGFFWYAAVSQALLLEQHRSSCKKIFHTDEIGICSRLRNGKREFWGRHCCYNIVWIHRNWEIRCNIQKYEVFESFIEKMSNFTCPTFRFSLIMFVVFYRLPFAKRASIFTADWRYRFFQILINTQEGLSAKTQEFFFTSRNTANIMLTHLM